MGSVPDLYTTGDNDPEVIPVRYYRHYLYCDACDSFALETWMAAEHATALDHRATFEKTQRRLGKAALFCSLLALVTGWLAVGLVPSPTFLLVLVAGITLALVARGFIWKALWGSSEPVAARWRFLKATLPWLVAVAAAEWLASEFFLSPWLLILPGLLLASGLLVWREARSGKIAAEQVDQTLGMRCTQCEATYPNNSPFFTDLDANPRRLAGSDVPRPLGSSTFLTGKSVEYEPPEPSSRLPQ